MTALRPFASESELINTAAEIWSDLQADDWLEAFSAHPMIGEMKAAPAQQARSADWSSGEQAGVSSANDMVKQELAAANRAYYEKFGFIFIVCATGRTAEEMLQMLHARLHNDPATELRVAAEEQAKITALRLARSTG